jgi:hypothetical protein
MKTFAVPVLPFLVSFALALLCLAPTLAVAQRGAAAVPRYRIIALRTPPEKVEELMSERLSRRRHRIAALAVPDTITITVPRVDTGTPESIPAHPILRAINEKGQVVGSLLYTPPHSGAVPDRSVPLLWQKNKAIRLTGLGHIHEVAQDINNRGQIVGYSYGSTDGLAWIWHKGKAVDLNRCIPAGSGWILRMATTIDERGRITGIGLFKGEPRSFRLTPR